MFALVHLKKGFLRPNRLLSKWIFEAISFGYEASGQPSPMAVRAYTLKSIVASKALSSGYPFNMCGMWRAGPLRSHW